MSPFLRSLLAVSIVALPACSAEPSPGGASSASGTSGATGGSGGQGSGAGAGGSGGGAAITGCTGASGRGLCRVETGADWAASSLEGTDASAGAVTLATAGLSTGTDANGIYNGGSYSYGTVTTAELVTPLAFDSAVVSWNAETPAGAWLAFEASARVAGEWTGWYRMGVWASGGTDVTRHSFDDPADAHGHVATDTVVLDASADAVRVRATLFSVDGVATPVLHRLAVALADTHAGTPAPAGGEAWGKTLEVPQRSQMMFPNGGEVWCSPTSTSMIMAYWAEQANHASWSVPVPEAADATYDAVYDGNGNWPFNVAFAASLGLEGAVGWFGSANDLEPWIAAGVPLAVSAAWGPGELDGAPVGSTNGHLIVVAGFDAGGDFVVNDPAAPTDATVRRVYDRGQFEKAWLGGSGGVAYLIFPPGTAAPW